MPLRLVGDGGVVRQPSGLDGRFGPSGGELDLGPDPAAPDGGAPSPVDLRRPGREPPGSGEAADGEVVRGEPEECVGLGTGEVEAVRVGWAEAARVGRAEAMWIGGTETARVRDVRAVRAGWAETARTGKAETVRAGWAEAGRAGRTETARVGWAEAGWAGEARTVRIGQAETVRIGQAKAGRAGKAETARAGNAKTVRIGRACAADGRQQGLPVQSPRQYVPAQLAAVRGERAGGQRSHHRVAVPAQWVQQCRRRGVPPPRAQHDGRQQALPRGARPR